MKPPQTFLSLSLVSNHFASETFSKEQIDWWTMDNSSISVYNGRPHRLDGCARSTLNPWPRK